MEESPELRAAIEDLYATFASYPLRADTNPCPCCHRSYDEERLHRRPLRKLGIEDLQQYATDALLVWGNEADFKHFLPRIFELEVAHGDEFVDPQVAMSKLTEAEWRYWPEPEQRSVERLLKLIWLCVITTEPHPLSGLEMNDWLSGIAQAESDISQYLETWLATQGENTRLNLAAFIAQTEFAQPNSHADAYWGGRDELFQEVKHWVRSDSVKSEVATIAAEHPEYDFVERAYILLS